MKTKLIALAIGLTLTGSALAESRTITLTADWEAGRTNATLVIQPYEIVEVISYKYDPNVGASWTIIKDGVSINRATGAPESNFTVAGPAVLKLTSWAFAHERTWVTVRITPETYPANDAIVVPAGPYGATVNLQSSTNLLNWTTISSFSYTNEPTSQFFRVRLDAAATVSGQQQPAPAFIKGVDMKK